MKKDKKTIVQAYVKDEIVKKIEKLSKERRWSKSKTIDFILEEYFA